MACGTLMGKRFMRKATIWASVDFLKNRTFGGAPEKRRDVCRRRIGGDKKRFRPQGRVNRRTKAVNGPSRRRAGIMADLGKPFLIASGYRFGFVSNALKRFLLSRHKKSEIPLARLPVRAGHHGTRFSTCNEIGPCSRNKPTRSRGFFFLGAKDLAARIWAEGLPLILIQLL